MSRRTLGGPIRPRSRLVLRQRAHRRQHRARVPTVYYNLNAGDPARVVVRAGSQPAGVLGPHVRERERADHLAGDAAQQDQRVLGCAVALPQLHGRDARPRRAAAGVAGSGRRPRPAAHVTQVTWSSPLTTHCSSKRASAARTSASATSSAMPNPTRDLIRVAEQCASGCAANGNIPGLVYRSQDFSVAHTGSYLWKGSLSYVTGTHSLKIGYQHTLMTDDRTWMTNDQNLTYRVNNGVPNQLTAVDLAVGEQRARRLGRRLRPGAVDARPAHAAGRGAIRSRAQLVSGAAGGAVAIPADADRDSGDTRRRQLQGHHAADSALAYDVFGDGRTAVKLSVGRYLEGVGVVRHLRQHQPDAADAADDVGVRHGGRDARLDRREPELRARLRSLNPARRISGRAAATSAA